MRLAPSWLGFLLPRLPHTHSFPHFLTDSPGCKAALCFVCFLVTGTVHYCFCGCFCGCYVLCYAPASRPASSAVHIVIKGAPVSLAHRSMGSRIACCLCLSRGSGCPLRSSMGSGYAHLSLSSLYRFRLNIAQASGGYTEWLAHGTGTAMVFP